MSHNVGMVSREFLLCTYDLVLCCKHFQNLRHTLLVAYPLEWYYKLFREEDMVSFGALVVNRSLTTLHVKKAQISISRSKFA